MRIPTTVFLHGIRTSDEDSYNGTTDQSIQINETIRYAPGSTLFLDLKTKERSLSTIKQHFYIQIGTGLEPSYPDFTPLSLSIVNYSLSLIFTFTLARPRNTNKTLNSLFHV